MADEQRCEPPKWQGRERRRTPELTMDELNAHIDLRAARSLSDHEDRMNQRLDMRFGELREMLRSAFPEGDPVEHRRAHEQMIEFHKQRADFYRDLKKQLASKGMLALIGIVLIALWHYVGDAIRRGGA